MKEHKNLRLLRILSFLAVFAMLLSVVGCDFNFGLPVDTTSGEASGDETTGKPASTTVTAETTTAPDDTKDPNSTEILPPEDTTAPEDTDSPGEVITYVDPLTGLRGTVDCSRVRPVAIFFDNVSAAAPQSGISKMDILIETVVEGGITRLVGITNDYIGTDGKGTKDVYGPIRSARPYMVSLSQAFGALMVGAGGSPQGYETIRNLGLDYLDNERDRYAGLCFFRDADRLSNSGYEHSLMASGIGIELLAKQNSYSLTKKTNSAFNFIGEGKSVYLSGGTAAHAIIKYSIYQQVQLVYSKTTGTYYRYQNGDVAHYDAANGEQLNFKNVLILFADTANISGDTEGRLDIQTTGSGEGYYLTGGRYTPIKWSRASDTSELVITNDSGTKITFNRGKTFISIVNASLKGTSSVELNYKVGN